MTNCLRSESVVRSQAGKKPGGKRSQLGDAFELEARCASCFLSSEPKKGRALHLGADTACGQVWKDPGIQATSSLF